MIQVLYARRKADSRMLPPILIECTMKRNFRFWNASNQNISCLSTLNHLIRAYNQVYKSVIQSVRTQN